MRKSYQNIVDHYESCVEKFGDTHKGVDWPNKEDAEIRYEVMLDVIRFGNSIGDVSILDFGCGTAHLLEYIQSVKLENISYTGLDISPKFIDIARDKFAQHNFICADILEDTNVSMPNQDYIILNGVFTEKRELNFDDMWDYFTKMLKVVYSLSNKGIAFNVMSKVVDWERDDLFHVPHDSLSQFICKNLSRNYIIRNDYGLYEYTVYVYKK